MDQTTLDKQNNFQVEKLLLNKKNQIHEEIKAMETDDPVMAFAEMVESRELGTDSWMADVHAKTVATKNNLLEMSQKIEKALSKLKNGTYGKCDKCGRFINPERLKVMPVAEVCNICL
jgi:DnaK suppressor protein